ncbi:DUF2846 domain-containing protein [Thiothrix sp.]|uniref:DUF2846 domain-containing protein n=1 Tax=Thiothrix sp. TaxID=1032 RepID=UPI002638592E|nr:DUF2846 domain-containing protein [Thiothrix sp.]
MTKLFTYCLLSLLIVVLSITGCAAGPVFKEQPEPTNGQSLVYLYRPSAIAASMGSPSIYLDGIEQKATLTDGGYMVMYTTPGRHTITAKGKSKIWGWGFPDASVMVDAKPQSKHYIRLSTSITAIYAPTALDFGLSYAEVPLQQGNAEIRQCSLIQ